MPPGWVYDISECHERRREDVNLVGRHVHVRGPGPKGWVGTVRSLSGSVCTIVDRNGVWHMVDYTRQEVTPI